MISPTVEQLSEQLGDHRLFRTLDSPALERLLRAARVEKLSRHDVLYEPDDRAEKVVLVLSGVVKTTVRLEGGREIILNLFGPGDLVGDEAVSQERRRAGASVLRDAVVVLFPTGTLQALWARHSDFANAWIDHIFQERLRLESRITELAYGNIEDRLMRMLTHLSEHHGTRTNGSPMM
ncbi:MAG: Crp/Fnr family transcriptional regulator, partial [Chloroflexi bacterium]|nr:Crp/Fnr family transcriptional regulator [Chloroflexota bacterium]